VDYIAEVLKHLRTEDFTGSYKKHFEITSEVSTRDQTGFEKTFSGLMKILYPDGNATAHEVEELLSFAMEARRRVREHILRIDDTFKRHDFIYRPLAGGASVTVLTPEEVQYPTFAGPRTPPNEGESEEAGVGVASENVLESIEGEADKPVQVPPQPGHVVVPENTKGWSYRRLFAKYLRGARKITINDPYVRLFFQARNVMEFLEMVHELVPDGDEAEVHLITKSDSETCEKQDEHLNQIVSGFTGSRVAFSWELDHNPNFHARSILTDTGWKITIDRGLDIFQRFESGPFSVEQAIQEARLTRGAEISYLRI
jgi:ATP-dependent Lon protease